MLTNKQVVEKFVRGETARATHLYSEKVSGDGSLTLFSYGPHFPLARRITFKTLDYPMIVGTTRTYSVTTQKHDSLVRTHIDFRTHNCDLSMTALTDRITQLSAKINQAMIKHGRARKDSWKEMWLGDIRRAQDEIARINGVLDLIKNPDFFK